MLALGCNKNAHNCIKLGRNIGRTSQPTTGLNKGHSITVNSCDYCDGSPCYCDISGLKANDAMYALVNGGDTALWQFLEDYYKAVFKGKEYPEPAEYKNP